MKPLLNTLFITQDDMYLGLDGENIVVRKDNKDIARFPLHNFEQITTFGYMGASPALMYKCAANNIALNFMTPQGRFQARVIGKKNGNVLLRREQYRRSDDAAISLCLAKAFITGKIYNGRWLLKRMLRDHAPRLPEQDFIKASQAMRQSYVSVQAANNIEEVRGIEGKAAVTYFSVFDRMILNQRKDFFFTERNRRPPLDCMNCLLSFLYALLANDVGAALEGVGLDSYVGFLHRDRPGRQSLALDMMEELRAVMADRVALAMVNTKAVTRKDFLQEENGAVLLTDDGRRRILSLWHQHKEEEIMHPFVHEKIKWGLVPHVQSILLARYLRGDLDGYPPFLWK